MTYTDPRPRWARGRISWWGLRCKLRMCPHMSTDRGYMCVNCLREKLWEAP